MKDYFQLEHQENMSCESHGHPARGATDDAPCGTR